MSHNQCTWFYRLNNNSHSLSAAINPWLIGCCHLSYPAMKALYSSIYVPVWLLFMLLYCTHADVWKQISLYLAFYTRSLDVDPTGSCAGTGGGETFADVLRCQCPCFDILRIWSSRLCTSSSIRPWAKRKTGYKKIKALHCSWHWVCRGLAMADTLNQESLHTTTIHRNPRPMESVPHVCQLTKLTNSSFAKLQLYNICLDLLCFSISNSWHISKRIKKWFASLLTNARFFAK